MNDVADRVVELERLGLGHRLRLVSGPQGPTVVLDGEPVLLLCSNNYLGLADHPRVREAAADAALRWGAGAAGSRSGCGTMTIHGRLEERLAAFHSCQACLLLGSGYLANLGVIGALAGPGDAVFSDELNHASIVDGCRLSGAEMVVYRHLDVEHLEWCMRRHAAGRDGRARRLIVTDSVFPLDGDIAPLHAIVEIAGAHDARLAVNESHATGVLGDGHGAVAHAGLLDEVDVVIGSLGTALGSYGAYACGDEQLVRLLVSGARPFAFSTAPGPPAVAAALAALELLEQRPHRVARLHANARQLRRALAAEGFAVAQGDLPTLALVLGEERTALAMCAQALRHGVFAQAVYPPSVPSGSARLRLAAMASHTAADLTKAAVALGAAAKVLGLDPATIGPPRCAATDQSPVRELDTQLAEVATVHPPPAVFDLQDLETRELAGHDLERRELEPPGAPYDHELSDPSAAELGRPYDQELDPEVARAA
jgi:glycine C-acetyltransferase/8-amino-7-oxononanoate synthase